MTNPQDKTQGMSGNQSQTGDNLSDTTQSQAPVIQGVNEDDASFEKRRQAQIDQQSNQSGGNNTQTSSTSS